MAERCMIEAKYDLRSLRSAVQQVAKEEGVPVDYLANYLAYRLSFDGENWWGTARNLQKPGSDPWLTVRNLFLEHADLSKLADPDTNLLRQALSISGGAVDD